MEDLRNALERLKGLRIELSVSAEEMAAATGVSVDEYERVEAGAEDVSFSFLWKCANKLSTDISSIITGDDPKLSSYTLSRKGEGMPINRRVGFNYSHVAYLLKDRLSEPFVVTAKYSAQLEKSPIALSNHGGQELNYVLEGRLKIQIDNHIEILESGDSIYYEAKRMHGMVAIDGADCKFLSVVVKGSVYENVEPVFKPAAKSDLQTVSEDKRLYKRYVAETFDENGIISKIDFNYPDSFNFVYDVVDKLAAKSPDKRAMLWVSGDGEERNFSFGDMAEYSKKTANYFRRIGIKKGDKVMLVLRRHYQFWYSVLALHRLGATAIPATDQLMAKDFVYRFNTAGVDAIVCTGIGGVAKMVETALADSPTVKIKCMANGSRDGWENFDSGIKAESGEFERVDTLASDPMLMYFTSGTTGYPKIVVQSFAYPLGHIVTARWWHNVREDGLHFTFSDTGWAKSMWGKLYGQWLCEAAVFTCDFLKFSPVDLLPMFRKYNITTFCAPPTIYRFFIKEDLKKFDLSSLKHATIAGEALNPEVYQQFYAATGLKLMEAFGQTEATVMALNSVGMEPKPGSMGRPSPAYDLMLINADGNPVKSGEVGELAVYTKNRIPMGMFSGYYLDEEKTNEAWHDDYYHTGDMAWQDEDGYLWYVGRTDDLIKSSGYRIGPFEIESVIMEMPCVVECAVTGVPDPVRGQIVKATIVLAKGEEPTDGLKQMIQNHVKEHTAPYKYPRIIEFVENLPKTISGKIRRVEIRNS